ncbi:hypothetical protein PYW08_005902 [Mythimna loreyi]|uniref:Uncharacterized protein n=1 Tax=Mythimna loreyi TaxID=667449 RepID=A0ACC2QN38_9NEOP|nr:hypothetical protein PYW08_005902 [Mythimna loreyi]
MSDSDIPQTISSSPYENVSKDRYKRTRCQAFSPGSELQDFKQEILEMLNTWKAEQQAIFSKFSQDQCSCLSKLVSEVAELKAQNKAIQKSNQEIEKTISFITNQYDDLILQVGSLKKENMIYRNCIHTLETKIEDLQQFSRPSCVEIRNVPVKDKESAVDLAAIVTRISKIVGESIDGQNIRDVYRLPGKPGIARPVVAEFTTVQAKNSLLTSVRSFNNKQQKETRLSTLNIGIPGDRRPIYVGDYLPASSKKLFFEAREFAKQMNYKFCWTNNGIILLREREGAKRILVKSEQTLRDLAQVNQAAGAVQVHKDNVQVNQ